MFYIQQVTGPHVQAIVEALESYRTGWTDAHDTWTTLSILYRRCRHLPCPDYSEHEKRGMAHIDHMLIFWFPLWANMWGYSKDSLQLCQDRINDLPTDPSISYGIYGEY